MTGAELIAAERRRQVEQEGWTASYDDEHTARELVGAAICYAKEADQFSSELIPDSIWPWDREWWKPSPDPVRNLVKAGALIAAEIDRLQRVEGDDG